MNTRYFWGTPHTDTDINAFEAAVRGRTYDVSAGNFAAVAAVERALETISRRSAALLQIDVLFVAVTLLLSYKLAPAAPEWVPQLVRWSFAMALLSGILLLPNLGLVWARDAGRIYGNAREGFLFAIGVHKLRAGRYTIALWLAIGAFALMLVAFAQLR